MCVSKEGGRERERERERENEKIGSKNVENRFSFCYFGLKNMTFELNKQGLVTKTICSKGSWATMFLLMKMGEIMINATIGVC